MHGRAHNPDLSKAYFIDGDGCLLICLKLEEHVSHSAMCNWLHVDDRDVVRYIVKLREQNQILEDALKLEVGARAGDLLDDSLRRMIAALKEASGD